MKNTKYIKGFTLTEIAIVLAVIAIILAIVVPNFSNIVKNSKGSASLSKTNDLYAQYVIDNSKSGTIDEELYIEADGGYILYLDGNAIKDENDQYIIDKIYVNDDLLGSNGIYLESKFKDHDSILQEFLKDFNAYSKSNGYNEKAQHIGDFWKSYLDETSKLVTIENAGETTSITISEAFILEETNAAKYEKWSWLFEKILEKAKTIDSSIEELSNEAILQNIPLFFLESNGELWDNETYGDLKEDVLILDFSNSEETKFNNYYKAIPRELFFESDYIDIPVFPIYYELTSGNWDSNDTVVNEFSEGDVVVLATPVREGYRFLGWYDNSNEEDDPDYLNGTLYTSTSQIYNYYQEHGQIDENTEEPTLKLYPKWEINNYIVDYGVTQIEEDGVITGIRIGDVTITIDDIINDFLSDYNSFSTNSWSATSHTADSFYALDRNTETQKNAGFMLNSSQREKWVWLGNYIASVASEINKKPWQDIYNYANYNAFYYANESLNIYSAAYELRGFIGQKQYTKTYNGIYNSADYSDSVNRNKIWYYYLDQLFETDKKYYTVNSTTITLPDINLESFLGWYDNPECTGNVITEIAQGSTGNIKLYPKWKTYQVVPGDSDSATYETIQDAINDAGIGSKIYVSAGTYNEALNINKKVTILGPNKEINGNHARTEEAIIAGLTNINASGVTLDGIMFDKAIKVGGDYVTITNCKVTPSATVACNGQSNGGCIVDSANISDLEISYCYIDAPGTANSETGLRCISFNNVTNLTITGNYITNSDHKSSNGSYKGIEIFNCSGKLNVTNNEIRIGTKGYSMYFGYTSNSCTEVNIIDNIIDNNNLFTYTAGIMVRKGVSGSVVTIMGNEIRNCCESILIFNESNSTVKVMYNNFGEGTIYKTGTNSSVTPIFENNYYAETQETVTSDVGTFTNVEEYKAAYANFKNSKQE